MVRIGSETKRGSRRRSRGAVGAAAVITMLVSTLMAPADAGARRVSRVDTAIGFVYGTFNADSNYVMLVGGSVEEFCDEYPEDPFFGAPGTAKALVIENADGSGEFRVQSHGQPLYIYESGSLEGPPFIYSACDAFFAGEPAPEPFATGTANLRVRDQFEANGDVHVFNQARGRVTDAEGNQYYVNGSADIDIVDGEYVGAPSDFVSFEMKRFPK